MNVPTLSPVDWHGLQQAGWTGAHDLNARDERNGATPLMWAVDDARGYDFVPALIAAGADLHAVDRHGEGVVGLAMCDQSFPHLLNLLLDAGAPWCHEDMERADTVNRDQEFLAIVVDRGLVTRGGRGDQLSPMTPCRDRSDLSLEHHRFEPKYGTRRKVSEPLARRSYEQMHRAWVVVRPPEHPPRLGRIIEWWAGYLPGQRQVLVRWYEEASFFIDRQMGQGTEFCFYFQRTDACSVEHEGDLTPFDPHADHAEAQWRAWELDLAIPAATQAAHSSHRL